MSNPKFSGSFVALITPFNKKGQIDVKTLEKLVEWHVQEGTDGLVVCGSTGEAPTLSDREREKIAQICIRTAAKRIPIVVGTGTSDTRQSRRLSEKMAELGADGALVVTPYYNKPSQRGMIAHFEEVAKANLPIIAYNNPGRAVVKLSPETIAELAKIKNVVALKDSTHDLELLEKTQKLTSIPIFSGEDDLTAEIILRGGVGSISVIGNVIPKAWKQMIACALKKEEEAARGVIRRYLPLCQALFRESNPQGIKFAVEWIGKAKGFLRLPLVEPLEETKKEIKQALIHLALPEFEAIKMRS